MFQRRQLSITSLYNWPPRQDVFFMLKLPKLHLSSLVAPYFTRRCWGVHSQHLAERRQRTRQAPPGWRQQPGETEEVDQGCVRFSAVIASSPSPARHGSLPLVPQVSRWVQLTMAVMMIKIKCGWRRRSENDSLRVREYLCKQQKAPMGLLWLAESFCAFSCSIHVTVNTDDPPQGLKTATDCQTKLLNWLT